MRDAPRDSRTAIDERDVMRRGGGEFGFEQREVGAGEHHGIDTVAPGRGEHACHSGLYGIGIAGRAA